MDNKLENGTTLIELIIILVIFGIISIITFRISTELLQQNSALQQVAIMQQNLRLATKHFSKNLRMAGFGIPKAIQFGTSGDMFYAVTPYHNQGSPDSIRISGNFKDASTLLETDMTTPEEKMKCQDISIFQPNQYAIISDGIEREVFHIDELDTINQEITHPALNNVYSAGSIISATITYTYYIDESNPAHPKFLRNADGKISTVADDIEAFSLFYFDGMNELANPANPGDIIGVRFEFVARTANPFHWVNNMQDNGYKKKKIGNFIMLRNVNKR